MATPCLSGSMARPGFSRTRALGNKNSDFLRPTDPSEFPHCGSPVGVALQSVPGVSCRPAWRLRWKGQPERIDPQDSLAMKLFETAKACVLSLAIMPLAGAALDF